MFVALRFLLERIVRRSGGEPVALVTKRFAERLAEIPAVERTDERLSAIFFEVIQAHERELAD